MRWAWNVAHMGENRNAHSVLVRKTEGKRPRGRLRRRWESNIKINLTDKSKLLCLPEYKMKIFV